MRWVISVIGQILPLMITTIDRIPVIVVHVRAEQGIKVLLDCQLITGPFSSNIFEETDVIRDLVI